MAIPSSCIGALARVKHVANGYRLPEGLPEGARVKIVAFSPGWYTVEYEGKQFHVFMAGLYDFCSQNTPENLA